MVITVSSSMRVKPEIHLCSHAVAGRWLNANRFMRITIEVQPFVKLTIVARRAQGVTVFAVFPCDAARRAGNCTRILVP